MLCLIFNWEVVPRSFWLKDFFLKDIMNAPLNKKKSKNKGKCHSTCTSTWNFWSASTLSRRCWLKFLTWPLMNLMLDEGWFLRVTISNWDRGNYLRFLITLISRNYLMKFVTAYESYFAAELEIVEPTAREFVQKSLFCCTSEHFLVTPTSNFRETNFQCLPFFQWKTSSCWTSRVHERTCRGCFQSHEKWRLEEM